MKTLIICESLHHGNTRKIADAMAAVMGADVKRPSEVDIYKLAEYDIIGFGSGIYMSKMHKNLLELADKLPKLEKKAFVFSTSGRGTTAKFHDEIKEKLSDKGFKVMDEFGCKGFDTFGPFKFVGGLNKGKPDVADLENAKQFAAKLMKS